MIGAVLAGGEGRRMGGASKPATLLAGRALVSYPVAALSAVCEKIAVVCKADTRLPQLPGAERWDEPDEPRHPLAGIVHALERAGEPVLICAADMPFVTPDGCRALLSAGAGGGSSPVVAVAGGALHPVFGLYSQSALDSLRAAAPGSRLTDVVEALDPIRVAVPPQIVANVNTPGELAAAADILDAVAP